MLPDLTSHMAEHVEREAAAFVFLGERGGRLRRSNFRRATEWKATVQKVGLPVEFHFHDLRHTDRRDRDIAAEMSRRAAAEKTKEA